MRLFLRTRHAPALIATLVIVAASAIFVTTAIIRPTIDSQIRIPAGLLLPLIPAVVLGATSSVPTLAIREARAGRKLWISQLGWLCVASALSTFTLVIATHDLLDVGYSAVAVVRNSLGLIGLSLLTCTLLGPALSWALPLAWLVIPGYIFANLYEDPVGILTFFAQPSSQATSSITGIVLFLVGLTTQVMSSRASSIATFIQSRLRSK